jgi:hypothetical protein
VARGERERDDARTLALVVLVVPLTWWLLLGWSWPRSIAGHDAIAHDLLMIREVAESGQGWSSLVYRPDLLGGFKGRDTLGPFPLFPLLAWLGASAVAVSVASAFIVQALLGFLGCRATQDVAAAWSGDARRLLWLERLGTLWLCAFAPALAWRLSYGHLNLVTGLLPFAAALALVVAAAARTVTVTLVALAAAGFVLGLLHSGQQIVVAGVVFGAPVLAGAWLSLGGSWRRLAPLALVPVGAFLIALPGFWGMLAHARGSDAPRALGEATVIYDFITATARDWVTSIPWTVASLPAARDAAMHHEVNYPIGPLLLLLAAVPWGRARALGLGLGLSLAAVLVLSMDLAPISRALLALVPPLKSFRVPERAVLPWLWAVSILAIAALMQRRMVEPPPGAAAPAPRARRRRDGRAARGAPGWWRPYAVALAVPLAVGLWLMPSAAREVAVWALTAAGVVVLLRGRGPAVAAVIVVLVLGVGGVGAFRERLLPFTDAGALLAEAGRLGDTVRRAKPELESPLTRARLDLTIPAFAVNTGFAAGLSSLDGYGVPTRRFAALWFTLRGGRREPTAVFFALPPGDPAFRALRQLYNVAWEVTVPSAGRLTLAPLGPTAGPAWFSASIARATDLPSLARELRAPRESLHRRAAEVLWLDGSDPAVVRAALPAAVDPGCRDARVVQVEASRRRWPIVARTEAAAACPLTFAMNFSEDLRATAVLADGRRLPVAVFPGYGALASLIAPAGTRQLTIQAEPPRLPLVPAWVIAGVAAVAAAALLEFGACRESTKPS